MARDTYTKEQKAALETMKQDGLELGAARKEFVNKILLPDGKVGKNIAALRAAGAAALAEAVSNKDFKAAAIIQEKLRELDEHIEQKRFLFIAGDDGMPLIYFQCAVAGNTDVYPEEAEK